MQARFYEEKHVALYLLRNLSSLVSWLVFKQLERENCELGFFPSQVSQMMSY